MVLGLAAAATVVGVLLMLLAALITSKVTGANFGELGPAALKLTAIYLAANGVGALVGGAIGSLIAAAAFFSLIIWLFELEMPYAVAFTVINWGIQFVAGLMIAGATARRY